MQLDGQAEEEDTTDIDEDVYAADLQVEEEETPALPEASIDAGSPLPPQQRRRMRSYTMRLSRSSSTFTPTHARGSSDTASMMSAVGRTAGSEGVEPEMLFTRSRWLFTHRGSTHGSEGGVAEMELGGVEVDDDDDDDADRMQIDID